MAVITTINSSHITILYLHRHRVVTSQLLNVVIVQPVVVLPLPLPLILQQMLLMTIVIMTKMRIKAALDSAAT